MSWSYIATWSLNVDWPVSNCPGLQTMATGEAETLPVEWVESVATGASGDEYGKQWDVAGRVGEGGRRVVDEADVQLDAVCRRAQLLETGSAADVAAVLARLRSHLSGCYSLHHRHKHAR